MKYYKNLFKRKRYVALLVCLGFFLLGAFVFYSSFSEFMDEGVTLSDTLPTVTVSTGIIGLISTTNIGMALIGLFIMFIGLVWLPMNSPFSQDDSDYDIRSEGENIYIHFKDNEFLVKKSTFAPTDLFFKDRNNRFVSMTRGYQIYNYVMQFHKDLTELEVDTSKVILESEVVDKFSNIRKLTTEEKEEFLKNQRIKNKPKILFIIISIFLWGSFAFWMLGLILMATTPEFEMDILITLIVLALLCYIFGKKSNIAITKDKKLYEKVINEDMYVARCQIFDKKNIHASDDAGVHEYYYVKVTDGNYIVNKWVKTTEKIYNQYDNNVNLYIFDKTGKYFFTVY